MYALSISDGILSGSFTGDKTPGMGYAAIVDIAGVFGEENTHRVGTTGIQTGDHVTFRIQDLDMYMDHVKNEGLDSVYFMMNDTYHEA